MRKVRLEQSKIEIKLVFTKNSLLTHLIRGTLDSEKGNWAANAGVTPLPFPLLMSLRTVKTNQHSSYLRAMRKSVNLHNNPVFKPKDRYYINRHGWWFYTADMIGGPFTTKPNCVDACRRHIQSKYFATPDRSK